MGKRFTASLTADPYSSVFEVDGLPPPGTPALSSGLVARGRQCVAEFQPSKVIVLQDNADAGGWMSVDALEPYEEHALLVASELISAVERVLKDAAESGWQRWFSRSPIRFSWATRSFMASLSVIRVRLRLPWRRCESRSPRIFRWAPTSARV